MIKNFVFFLVVLMSIGFFVGMAHAALPPPTNLEPSWIIAREGQYGYDMRFAYDASALPSVKAFRFYLKSPPKTAFSPVADFNNPSLIYSECPGATSSAGKEIRVGDWELIHFCSGGFWTVHKATLEEVAAFPAGQYDFYLVAIDAAGAEAAVSETASQYALEPSILFPATFSGPANETVTFRWSIPSGWPSGKLTVLYSLDIFEGTRQVYNKGIGLMRSALPQEYSYVYDGPKLDPGKTYTVSVVGTASYGGVPYISMGSPVHTFRVGEIVEPTPAPNRPPNTPGYPYGAFYVRPGEMHLYGTSADDPDGDMLKYVFDWGDGTTSESHFMPSNYGYQGSHAWTTPGKYKIRAMAEDVRGGRSAWTDPIVIVEVAAMAATQSVTVTKPATEEIVVAIPDGARVTLAPAAALAAGTVTVDVNPAAAPPPKIATVAVLSAVYDIAIRDQAGAAIRDLQGEIEIALPYKETELKKQGATEDDIYPSYFDEEQKTWAKIDNFSVDKVKNIVTARVRHLTRFAVVAAADITPPLAPANTSIEALDDGRIRLTWDNPLRDFDHVKIYRSGQSGARGVAVASDIRSEIFVDGQTGGGATYYYIVRAVDPAGNESLNAAQLAARAEGQPAAVVEPGGAFQNLRVGSSGEDVRIVQGILADEGLYPAGLVNGYFDEYTRQAVILFQEKYAGEILRSAGLSRGTGVVGEATWRKVEELKKAKEEKMSAPEPAEEKEQEVSAPKEEPTPPVQPRRGFFGRMWHFILRFFGLRSASE